jgi:DNA-binding response OmpR family regulator
VTVSVRLEPGADQDRVVRALRELALAGGTRIVDSDPAPASSAPSAPAGSADVRIHAGTRTVLRAGAPLPLSRLEYDLLHFLATHPRQVFTRLQLLGQVWGHTGAGARTVDVHVRRLRMKVGPDVPVVTTVHGVGYRLADGAPIVVDAD